MRKNFAYLLSLLVVLTLVCAPANAAKKKKDTNFNRYGIHYFTTWAGVGYSGLVNNYPTANGGMNGFKMNPYPYTGTFDSKFIGGGGGMIGLGYEMQYKKFLFGFGPEFRIFSSRDNILLSNPYDAQWSYVDAQGTWPMMNHYQFGDNLRETATVGQIMLPIQFGAKFKYWYFLAGAKVGYTVIGAWRQKGDLTTSVTDMMAVEDWYDLFNHDYRTETYKMKSSMEGKSSNKFGLDVAVTAEVGVNVEDFLSNDWNKENMKRRFPYHFRVAAFIDYGVMNLGANLDKSIEGTFSDVAFAAAGEKEITTNSIHANEWAGKYDESGNYTGHQHLNSLLVGVKGTFLLQLNKPTGRKPITPQLATSVMDNTFDSIVPLSGATINILNVTPTKSRNAKPAKVKKVNTNKQGATLGKFQEGIYNVWAEKPGYFAGDTIFEYALVEPEAPKNRKEKPAPQRVSFNLVKIPVWTVSIKDATTGEPVKAQIHVTGAEEGLMDTTLTGPNATLTFNDKKYLGKTYRLNVSADDYHSNNFTVSGKDIYGSNTFTLTPLVKILRTFDLKHMYFATNKTEILPMSETDLQYLYKIMSENPRIRILITGHTDSVGKDEANQKLSEGRSASVKNEMVSRGIAADRIETDGKGESEPIDTNETEAGRQNNRRVQITILNPEDAEVDIF